MPDPNLDPTRLLRRLYNGYFRRRDLPGGSAREATDAQLLVALGDYVERFQAPPVQAASGPPPRAIAVAMALAVHTQPHLAATMGRERPQGTEEVEGPPPRTPERPLLVRSETLAAALGLPRWEIEELREEVDRRASRVLKMRRVNRWLWSRHGFPDGDPRPLFRLLFPGLEEPGHVGLVRRGTQIYALVDQDPPPPEDALFLGWRTEADDRTFPPVGTFRSKYVDGDLRRAIGRAVGADDIEVIALLDRMVTVVPRRHADTWLRHDTWRASGASILTDLAPSYPGSAWLTAPLSAHDVSVEGWMWRDGDALRSSEHDAALDHYLAPRVTEMLRQCYGELLSVLSAEVPQSRPPPASRPRAADVDLYDAAGHLRAVTRPLLAWATRPETAEHVAAQLGVEPGQAEIALREVEAAWTAHLGTRWCDAPGNGAETSAQTRLTRHLIASRSSLRTLYHRPADPRGDHRVALLAFAGHYYASTPLERIWTADPRDGGADAIGDHFWGTWQRLLDAIDDDPPTVPPHAAEPTFGPF